MVAAELDVQVRRAVTARSTFSSSSKDHWTMLVRSMFGIAVLLHDHACQVNVRHCGFATSGSYHFKFGPRLVGSMFGIAVFAISGSYHL